MKRTVLALRGRKAGARVADEVWNFSPPADWDSESFDTPFPESRCALSLLRPRLCRVMASEIFFLGVVYFVQGPEQSAHLLARLTWRDLLFSRLLS